MFSSRASGRPRKPNPPGTGRIPVVYQKGPPRNDPSYPTGAEALSTDESAKWSLFFATISVMICFQLYIYTSRARAVGSF